MEVPRELLQIVDAARPVCSFYQRGWCKKGAACKKRHGPGEAKTLVPYVSRHACPMGTRLNLRPPLTHAIDAFFRSTGTPCTLGSSKVISNRNDLLLFQLELMAQPIGRACVDTKTKGFADVVLRTGQHWESRQMRKLGRCGTEYPKMLSHGTKLVNLLSILRDRALNSSEGIAGYGVYGFKVETDIHGVASNEAMIAAYERTATGGYNGGAVFFLECTPGILVNGTAGMIVPEGTITINKDQYSAHPSVLSYCTVMVSLDGMVSTLQEYLDGTGYTSQLHKSLQSVVDYVNASSSRASSSGGSVGHVKLTNPIVASGKHVQTRWGSSGGKNDHARDGVGRIDRMPKG